MGKLVLVNGIMDRFQYVNILANNLQESIDMMEIDEPIFQQDNDPKHKSNHAKSYFEQCSFPLLDWPSQSPDLNPIEHIWEYMTRELHGFKAKNKDELFKKVEEIWYKTPLSLVHKPVDSMKNRVLEAIKANGGPTRYSK